MHRLPILLLVLALGETAVSADTFNVGFAKRDITPSASVPMWGYGKSNRSGNMSTGMLDPLYAKAVVIATPSGKLAIVGLDLGRAPLESMGDRIRGTIRDQAGIDFALMVGSHTHHGPALEVARIPGKDQSQFEAAFAYYDQLEGLLTDVILEADKNAEPAAWGWVSVESNMNRNRHTEEVPVPRDSELFVLRFDDAEGKPIAHLVSFAAHPTNHPPQNNRFTADYPGVMMGIVEEALNTNCLFLQGAAGDMQCDMNDALWGKEDFMQPMGEWLARDVLAAEKRITTHEVKHASIQGKDDVFTFRTRVQLENNPALAILTEEYGEEITVGILEKYAGGQMHPRLSTVLINDELAIAGGSGEFFSALSLRLKNSVNGVKTIFAGYCNGHDLYFPTRRAMGQGGYGADPLVAWVEEGGPETMIDTAAANIETMRGSTAPAKR